MKGHLLERVQRIPASIDEVFAFFSDAGNLAKITPGWLGFRILTPQPITMREGALIDYRIALLGIPMRWRTEITKWDPPHVFVDTQLRGPYRSWVHTHRFEVIEGGVKMIDRVRYEMPLGPLGVVANALAVRWSLDMIFDHRAKVIAEELGAWPADEQAASLRPVGTTS